MPSDQDSVLNSDNIALGNQPAPAGVLPLLLRVLVVDDDKNILATLNAGLTALDCQVTQASSGEEALKTLQTTAFDLVLTDVRMGGMSGVDLITQARRLNGPALFVAMTAFASFDNAVAAVRAGAFDYLAKPFNVDQLEHVLGKVRKVVSLQRENTALKLASSHPEYFTGYTSPAMQRLAEMVRKVAPTDATVLVVGESGTGKSEFARLIHSRSGRSAKPFVEVNCASLAETLLESELFGHQKGAFSGAIQDKIGKLESAAGGTVFLDEVGELSPGGQAKLLRFLQERVIERVGSTKSIQVDARVVAATNKKLDECVAGGTFREDLYYRLNIFECTMVPLRYRQEDLPVLIQQLLESESLRAGYAKRPELPETVRKTLLAYPWPGNVRELRNAMQRLLILSEGRAIQLEDLPERIKADAPTAAKGMLDHLASLKDVERAQIVLVLSHEHNLERAANILGITTVTLWRKRREYGLA